MSAANTKYLIKLGWSLALFVSVIMTVLAIYLQNYVACLFMIVINFVIYHYGDPVINEKYNNKLKRRIAKAEQQKNQRSVK